MIKRVISMLISLAVGATTGMAGDLNGSPLTVTPRTAEDTARVAAIVRPTTDFTQPEPFEARPGGAATVPARTTPDAFSQPSGNMDFAEELDFRIGNGLFRKNWVAAPASTLASDGLGPLYNSRSCQDCHLKDGRGHPPAPGEKSLSMLLRQSPWLFADSSGAPAVLRLLRAAALAPAGDLRLGLDSFANSTRLDDAVRALTG